MLRPLKDWLFILPDKEEEGIIKLPDKRPEKGRIIAMGAGRLNKKGERLPMSLKVGDCVYFGGEVDGLDRLGANGYGFIYDGVKYFAIREMEVKGIL